MDFANEYSHDHNVTEYILRDIGRTTVCHTPTHLHPYTHCFYKKKSKSLGFLPPSRPLRVPLRFACLDFLAALSVPVTVPHRERERETETETETENGRRRHCQSVQPIKIGSAVFEYMQGWKHVCLHFYDRKREGSWNSIRPALNPRDEKFAGKIIYKQYLNT